MDVEEELTASKRKIDDLGFVDEKTILKKHRNHERVGLIAVQDSFSPEPPKSPKQQPEPKSPKQQPPLEMKRASDGPLIEHSLRKRAKLFDEASLGDEYGEYDLNDYTGNDGDLAIALSSGAEHVGGGPVSELPDHGFINDFSDSDFDDDNLLPEY
jgi:hypothetical protein